MPVNPDYRDLFAIFLEEKVDYLVVGAYATTFYTEPRYTKDIDLLIRPSPENAERVWKALERFDAPLENVTRDDFTNPDLVYQIGVEPNRIDILMEISGVDFESAWENREESTYGAIPQFPDRCSTLLKIKIISMKFFLILILMEQDIKKVNRHFRFMVCLKK